MTTQTTAQSDQRYKIVIDDAVPYAHEIFSHLGKVITLPGRDIRHEHLVDADALIIRSRTQVNQSLLQNTAVRFVGSTVVGLDHVDQAWLQKNNITFYSAQGCNANSVAEFVLTQMFQLAEQQEFNIQEKTLGIIGVGNVGSRLARKAEILGIKTLLNDPPRQAREQTDRFVDLDTALQADIISFHTPLTQEPPYPTYHLLSEARLKKIGSNSIIINAARGGIIDEAAWVNTPTLANLIDCWEDEPNINAALYQKATQATPHIAGHSLDAKIAGSRMVYDALCAYLGCSLSNDWQKNLPSAPPVIVAESHPSTQHILSHIFCASHNPMNDDNAIRSLDIETVHQHFEFYRRHYPEYREWHCQRVKIQDENLAKTLSALGFTTFASS